MSLPFQVGDLIEVARRILAVSLDEVLSAVDVEAAERALVCHSEEYAGDVLYGVVSERPFRTGNDAIAVLAAAQVLSLEDRELQLEPALDVQTLVIAIKTGAVDREAVCLWVTTRTAAADPPVQRIVDAALRRIRGRGTRQQQGGRPMFERFTDRARKSVTEAQMAARDLQHDHIGTEHLLLGLLKVEDGVAAKVLMAEGLTYDAARRHAIEIVGRGPAVIPGHAPFTPRAKKVLEFSLREALQLGHNYIGTEHVLLGLIQEGEGVGAQILARKELRLDLVRQKVIEVLAGYAPPAATTSPDVVAQVAALVEENARLKAEIEDLKRRLGEQGTQTA